MSSAGPLLVVAGEGSGDVMGAAVLGRLPVAAFGWGGSELRARGAETLADVSELSVLGAGAELAARLPTLLRRLPELLDAVRQRRPPAALLIGFSEVNCWLGRRLRRRGVKVLWYGPPQIWAWRPGRARAVCRAADRLALLLPFEQRLWRAAGADATYVGHPALEHPGASRQAARLTLGAPGSQWLALLPGSRAQEVRRHLPVLLEAATRLQSRQANLRSRVLVAPALPAAVAEWVMEQSLLRRIEPLADRPAQLLPGFDLAAVASGTATLQCAVAAVPPAIVYRTDPVTGWLAARLLRVRWVGLPNLVLERAVFPELLQHDLSPAALEHALGRLLSDRARYVAQCELVRSRLEPPQHVPPSAAVAQLLSPWLS